MLSTCQVYKLKIEQRSHWDRTEVPNWNIYRRYSDFLKLHEKLTSAFPGIHLHLPPKRWMWNNFDPVFIGHRIYGLQRLISQGNSCSIQITASFALPTL